MPTEVADDCQRLALESSREGESAMAGKWTTSAGLGLLSIVLAANTGCLHSMKSCNTCETCETCETGCSEGCGESDCGHGKCSKWKMKKPCHGCGKWGSHGSASLCAHCRSRAIPDEYPVGAVMRAHYHQMQTNAEASDFILYQHDFVLQSAELTPDGKDKILEIAARMRSAPFPVVVERSENNADPELDAHRRQLIAQVLYDLGNTDAGQRVFVSPAYGPGKHSLEAAPEFYQHTFQGGGNNQFGNGGFGGGGGGFGGGGGGFGGGGGGFGGGGGGGGFGT
jgi:hypothetical protein